MASGRTTDTQYYPSNINGNSFILILLNIQIFKHVLTFTCIKIQEKASVEIMFDKFIVNSVFFDSLLIRKYVHRTICVLNPTYFILRTKGNNDSM